MLSYEYKVYHKETGEEIHEENFSQYFSQYIALDSDGDLVEIDSRDAVVVSVIDFAYIKFNKTDEYEAKAKAWDRIVDEMNTAWATMHKKESLVQYAAINAFWNIDEIIVDYESGESDEV